jgi:hypothetical protein
VSTGRRMKTPIHPPSSAVAGRGSGAVDVMAVFPCPGEEKARGGRGVRSPAV